MKKEDLIKLGLDDATSAKVADVSAEELKGFIPKARFDEVNDSKKQLEKDVSERDKQLETLKNSTGDVEALKKTITDLQTKNATDKNNYDAQVKKIQLENALDKQVVGSKAKNPKAVKALLEIDFEKAELDADGNIKGVADQLKKLTEAEDSKFLFDVQIKKPNTFTGIKPGEKKDGTPGAAPTSLADAVKMHFESNE